MFINNSILQQQYYGNTVESYITFGGIIFLGLIIGMILKKILMSRLKKLSRKTKNNMDDMIYDILDKPFMLTMFLLAYILAESALNPASQIYSVISNIGSIMMTILIGWYAIRGVDGIVKYYLKPMADKTESRIDDQLIPLISKALKYTIIILVILFIINNAGYDITSLIAGLGIGGLALAMASQEALSNLFGGIAIFIIFDWGFGPS